MKLYHRLVVFITGLLVSSLSGCDFSTDKSDCPQGIRVQLYSQSPCQIEATYPENIRNVDYYVFDKDGVLVAHQQNNSTGIQDNPLETFITGNGLFTVIAWAGLNQEHYDIAPVTKDVTRKEDLAFRLKRTGGIAASINGDHIYYGESKAVFIEDPKDVGTVFKDVSVNIQEVTSRVTIIVEGLPNADDCDVVIASENAAIDIDKSAAKDETVSYSPTLTIENNVLNAEFTVLKLETGYNDKLIIKVKQNQQELFNGSLLGALLLKNPEINLLCDRDFTIRFTTQDVCECGEYMVVDIWVNNWLVHSYDTEL